ncbi:MAG: DivIVA domain-containing protein [Geodermatophilaceae bacterium]|nr:DivIVA domain-containing protein [Geodermatophilaceae bacterium]
MFAVLLFLLASFAFGRGEEMAPAPPDSTPVELPDDRPVTGGDVRALRLSVAVRGYRMREVDWVLEQLATALDDRDHQLAELRDDDSPPLAPEHDPADGAPVDRVSADDSAPAYDSAGVPAYDSAGVPAYDAGGASGDTASSGDAGRSDG